MSGPNVQIYDSTFNLFHGHQINMIAAPTGSMTDIILEHMYELTFLPHFR
jgi:hypothetical protein